VTNPPNDDSSSSESAANTNGGAGAAAAAVAAAGAPPRKKKITRLIPAEESLAAIEECTERSEDSTVVTVTEIPSQNKPNNTVNGEEQEGPRQQTALERANVIRDKQASSEEQNPETTLAEKMRQPASQQAVGDQQKQQPTPPPSSSQQRQESAPKLPNGPQHKQVPPKQQQQLQQQSPPLATANIISAPFVAKIGDEPNGVERSMGEEKQAVAKNAGDGGDVVDDDDDNSLQSPPEHQQQHQQQQHQPPPTHHHPHHHMKEAAENSKASLFSSDSIASSLNHESVENNNDDDGLFDFDDDFKDESGASDKEDLLTWRLDPSESLSDWTIVVRTRGDDPDNRKVDTYHVHKNILAVGPRRSEYFANVFRQARKDNPPGETAGATSEVELGAAAAKVVPNFLDFMYSTEGGLDISTESATGLRHLAQLFGVRVLHKKVMDFIQKDLSLATCTTYYRDVCLLRDEKLLLTIAKYCSRNIMKIEPNFPLVEAMDAYFFAKVMSSPQVGTKEKKYHCSVLLADYCRKKRDVLDDKQFLMLCDEKVLPLVHHSAALTLLEMEADLVIATSLTSMLEMTSLQRRCIKELSHHWRDLSEIEAEHVYRVCRKLPSGVVTEMLVKSLANAKRKLLQVQQGEDVSIDSYKHKIKKEKGGAPPKGKSTPDMAAALFKKEYEMKLEKTKQEHNDELALLKKEYENNLVRLRDMLVEKDKTISKFWHEIKSFERLPNGHEGKLVASGRAHEATCVPELSRTTADGILLVTKKNAPKFPVFIYKNKRDDKSESAGSTTGNR